MISLQPLLAFSETFKRGSFAAASRELGCTPSSLAKAVSRLEEQLGVRLFHRTTRRVTPTDDGRRLFDRCQRVLTELDQLQIDATGASEEATGTLRISMPVAFGRIGMLPVLAELAARFPDLTIDARFSDRYVDIVQDGMDVAIRTGELEDSSLVARPFARQELLLFASPEYLNRAGLPESPADLARHTAVVFRVPSSGRPRPWQLRENGRPLTISPESRVSVDDGDAVVAAAKLGLGIGQVPHYMVTEAVANGELVELLPDFRPEPMVISVVMPSARLVPARVRALITLLEERRDRFPRAPEIPPAVSPRARRPGRPAPGPQRSAEWP